MTFGLLMAKARDISLSKGIVLRRANLAASDSLIGTALGFLTHNPKTLNTSLRSLTRVLERPLAVRVEGDPDAWLYFYEYFLGIYDPKLRKRTGSVLHATRSRRRSMIRLTDDALRDPTRFGLLAGCASPEVTILDPAVGTGTFLLGILRHIAECADGHGCWRRAQRCAGCPGSDHRV